MTPYHHLLFATDLSEINEKMRDKIFALASLFKARLTVVHVVTSFSALSRNYSLTVGLKEEMEGVARLALKEFCEPLQVPLSDQIIKTGHPVHAVVDTIKEKGIDLLLVGRNGESGFAHLLGSVSHRLLHFAPCELLLIDVKKTN
jgi:universal stress protein A